MNRSEKEKLVESLHAGFERAKFATLVNFKGLNVAEISSLRHELRNTGTEFRVIKNTLARRAIKGTAVEPLEEYLEGPNAVALTSQDPAPPAKVLFRYAKENTKLELKIGMLDGKLLTAEKMEALSKLPSREALYSMLLGTLQAPTVGLVNVLAGVLRKFLGTLQAIQEQKEKSTGT